MGNARYLMFRVSFVCGLALLLVACGGMPRNDRPAQIEDRTS